MYSVICVGDTAIDDFYHIDRIPAADEKVLARYLGRFIGGTTCNTARALKSLGENVLFVTLAGMDEPRTFIENSLNAIRLDHRVLTAPGLTSSFTQVMVTEKGEKTVLLLGSHDSRADITAAFAGLPPEKGKVVFSSLFYPVTSYLERLDAPIIASLELATLEGNAEVFAWVKEHAHTIILDRNSFAYLFHREASQTALHKAMQDQTIQCENLIVTCGHEGTLACSRQLGRTVYAAAYSVTTLDTTGAGDIFNAGYIYGFYIKEMPFTESLRFANALAAASCEENGTDLSKRAISRSMELFRSEGGRIQTH